MTTMTRTVDGLAQLAQHEAGAFNNQVQSLRERITVAKKARSFGELLRNQLDLLPDTHARLRRDHSVRSQLLQDFRHTLKGRSAA